MAERYIHEHFYDFCVQFEFQEKDKSQNIILISKSQIVLYNYV